MEYYYFGKKNNKKFITVSFKGTVRKDMQEFHFKIEKKKGKYVCIFVINDIPGVNYKKVKGGKFLTETIDSKKKPKIVDWKSKYFKSPTKFHFIFSIEVK